MRRRNGARRCPHDKSRVTNFPVEYLRIGIDGVPHAIDKWAAIAGLNDDRNDPDAMLVLADLIATCFRADSGNEEITAEIVIETVREMFARGVFGVGRDGRAYMGEPIYDALGRVVGSKRLTDAFRAEVAEEIRRGLQDQAAGFRSETGLGGAA